MNEGICHPCAGQVSFKRTAQEWVGQSQTWFDSAPHQESQ